MATGAQSPERPKKALVVHSGGLDSTVLLAQVVLDLRAQNVRTVTFDYGQRHPREVEAAQDIAAYYGVQNIRLRVELGHAGVLMDHAAEMPHLTYQQIREGEGPSPTYVPYRNGSFLSLAASLALDPRVEAQEIYAGMHAEDAHNWAYPDCTPEFIGAMQNAIYIGTYHKVRLVCPFTYNTKAAIVRHGHKLEVPFELTHSCYEGQRPACGQCPTCVSRLEAFRANNLNDPLAYDFDKYRRPV